MSSNKVISVRQAYQFALDPNRCQDQALWSHAGGRRFAWNWGLCRVREALDARAAEKTATGVAVTRVPTAFDLINAWNQIKKTDPRLSWWSENSTYVYQQAFRDLEQALRHYWKSRNGERKGRRLGFPKFKKRGRCRDSFRLQGKSLRCEDNTVTLPKLGPIRTHESTRKLSRRLANGTARITSATASRTAHRWYVSFAVEVQRIIPAANGQTATVGVDVGVRHLAVLSTGELISNPRPLDRSLRKLRRISRAYSRTKEGSAGRRETAARLARTHARVASVRRDVLHKLTTRLATEYGTVVVEDLNVAGMTRNRRLARAVADSGMGRGPPHARLQVRLVRCSFGSGRPLVSKLQDLFWLRRCENQARLVGAGL